jgi:hypothetical protein
MGSVLISTSEFIPISDIEEKKYSTEQNPAGYQTPKTRPCGVSDPAELSLAGYQTPQNNGRVVYIL